MATFPIAPHQRYPLAALFDRSAPRQSFAAALRFLVVLTSFALGRAAFAADFVVVSAEAIPQYNRPKTANGTPKPQSYAFSEGRHFGANTYDASDAGGAFMTLVKSLTPALAKQAYFPATNPKEADLLIVLHWGTTQIFEDPNRDILFDDRTAALSEYKASENAAGNSDPSRLNEIASEMGASASLQQQYMDRNAELLGFRRSLIQRSKRLYPSEEEITMRHEMNEERYFVVLMAYDYGSMRKDKKSRLLWTTHMSVRSAGTNFRIALPQMVQIASGYFGRDVVEPLHVQVDERKGHVDIGEPTVVPPSEPSRK